MIQPDLFIGSLGFHKFEMTPFEGKHIFDIAIIGDCNASVMREMSYDEISTFLSVFNAMEADGKYVPMLSVMDVTINRKNTAEEKRMKDEQRRLDAGIPPKGYNTIAAALIAAGWVPED